MSLIPFIRRITHLAHTVLISLKLPTLIITFIYTLCLSDIAMLEFGHTLSYLNIMFGRLKSFSAIIIALQRVFVLCFLIQANHVASIMLLLTTWCLAKNTAATNIQS